MLSRHFRHIPTLPALACTALLLTACDSAGLSGGAAGEVDNSEAAVALLAPFTGFYDLQDDWNGIGGDEAFLVIEAPGADAISPVSFYDYDDFGNCVPLNPFRGQLSKDLFDDRVFMDGILFFNEAELFLSGNTLTITFNDETTFDRISVTATTLGVSQVADFGTPC